MVGHRHWQQPTANKQKIFFKWFNHRKISRTLRTMTSSKITYIPTRRASATMAINKKKIGPIGPVGHMYLYIYANTNCFCSRNLNFKCYSSLSWLIYWAYVSQNNIHTYSSLCTLNAFLCAQVFSSRWDLLIDSHSPFTRMYASQTHRSVLCNIPHK